MGGEVDRSRDDAAGASPRPTHTPAIFARGLFRPRQAEPDRAAVPNLVWMRKRSAARRAHPLTERECLVLDRIGRDRTHKDIAAELGVSINTVANMAANAYRGLGAHSAAAAVLAHGDTHPEETSMRSSATLRRGEPQARRGVRRRRVPGVLPRSPREAPQVSQ